MNVNLCFPQVVSVSEVGVDIDIGPGCLAQVHRGVGSTGSTFTQLSNFIAGPQGPTASHA
jgi:hypothetical protein